MDKIQEKHLILFDATCPFCIACVTWILSIDKKHQFAFAPRCSKTAVEKLSGTLEFLQASRTVFLFEEGEVVYIRSRAFFRTLYLMGGFWKVPGVLYRLPARATYPIYRFVTKLRVYLSRYFRDHTYERLKEQHASRFYS